MVTGSFPGLMLFYVFYSMIRRHSGGFHCKTQAGCLLLSVVVLLVVVATKPIALDIVKEIFGGGGTYDICLDNFIYWIS